MDCKQFSLQSEPKERTVVVPSPAVWRLRQGDPGQCMRYGKTREFDRKDETPGRGDTASER